MTPGDAYARIVARLVGEPEVTTGRMFRSEGLRYGAKYFAVLSRGQLVVKLPADRVRELSEAGAGERFDPGHGRPMREWLSVPADRRERWGDLACEALDYARHLAG